MLWVMLCWEALGPDIHVDVILPLATYLNIVGDKVGLSSTWLIVCRWQPEVRLTETASLPMKAGQTCNLWAPVANNIFRNAKDVFFRKMCWNKSSAVWNYVGRLSKGISLMNFENWSIRITMFPWASGRSVMKYMARCYGWYLTAGNIQGTWHK